MSALQLWPQECEAEVEGGPRPVTHPGLCGSPQWTLLGLLCALPPRLTHSEPWAELDGGGQGASGFRLPWADSLAALLPQCPVSDADGRVRRMAEAGVLCAPPPATLHSQPSVGGGGQGTLRTTRRSIPVPPWPPAANRATPLCFLPWAGWAWVPGGSQERGELASGLLAASGHLEHPGPFVAVLWVLPGGLAGAKAGGPLSYR